MQARGKQFVHCREVVHSLQCPLLVVLFCVAGKFWGRKNHSSVANEFSADIFCELPHNSPCCLIKTLFVSFPTLLFSFCHAG